MGSRSTKREGKNERGHPGESKRAKRGRRRSTDTQCKAANTAWRRKYHVVCWQILGLCEACERGGHTQNHTQTTLKTAMRLLFVSPTNRSEDVSAVMSSLPVCSLKATPHGYRSSPSLCPLLPVCIHMSMYAEYPCSRASHRSNAFPRCLGDSFKAMCGRVCALVRVCVHTCMYVLELIRVPYLRTLTRHHANTDRTQPGPIFVPELNSMILMIDDHGTAI